MADVEKLKKEVQDLKAEIQKKRASGVAHKSAELRPLRRKLKHAQRKINKLRQLSLEEQLKRAQKVLDGVTKAQDVLVKEAKKKPGDPHVHSLRKKVKGLNRRIKRINRHIAKRKKAEQPSS